MKNLVTKKYLQMLHDFCDFSIFNRKNVLITGGTGMIGSYLVESIILGCQIQGFRPSKLKIGGESISNAQKQIYANLNYVELSADYLTDIKSAGENQIIFHLASPASPTHYKDLKSLIFVNSSSLNNILRSGVEKLIYFSSGEVYGNQPRKKLCEEENGVFDSTNKRDWYPLAKLEGEKKSKELCELYDIELTIIRLFHTFGPGVTKNDGRSFADFLYSAANGNLPILKSKGGDVRTFLYSPDSIVAFIKICNQFDKYNIYNIGGKDPLTILQFARKISELAGLNGELKFDFSLDDEYIHSPNKSIIPDVSKISNLGWKNRTSIDDAILETLHYIKLNSI